MIEIQKYNDSFCGLKEGTVCFQTREDSLSPELVMLLHSRIVETSSVVMELHPGNNNVTGIEQGEGDDNKETAVQLHVDEGDFSLLGPRNGYSSGLYDKSLSCFGCGIGWFSFLLGFAFPPLWYYATVLYFTKYYLKDPRERSGLAASAIAALICSVAVLISLLAVFL